MSNTRTFEFQTLLADSRAVVEVSCEIDRYGDVAEFNNVLFEGFNVYEVLSTEQWDHLTWEAQRKFKKEQEIQAEIDAEIAFGGL